MNELESAIEDFEDDDSDVLPLFVTEEDFHNYCTAYGIDENSLSMQAWIHDSNDAAPLDPRGLRESIDQWKEKADKVHLGLEAPENHENDQSFTLEEWFKAAEEAFKTPDTSAVLENE